MVEAKYMISEASKLVAVESHVLRYWEEELELPIYRNEMGHRYYTEENIRQFKEIKKFKEQGLQLKAIKLMLLNPKETPQAVMDGKNLETSVEPTHHLHTSLEGVSDQKIEQFQSLLGNVFSQVLRENNRELGHQIGHMVSDNVRKEMDYLMREQEEREEERYKRLDEAIRSRQKARKQVAATKVEKPKRTRKGFFRKKEA